MSDEIKVKYRDVEIEYSESLDRWVFTTFGRERSAETLALAKEAINKPCPKDKPPFERIPVFVFCYSEFKSGVVTSVAENRYSSVPCYWVVVDKVRSRESNHCLYPVSSHNTALHTEYLQLSAKIADLTIQRQQVKKKMKSLE